MQEVAKKNTTDQLHFYFVWLPVLRSDDRAAAVERAKEFQEARSTHYWDGEQLTGKAWDSVLKTEQLAWDVYLIYAPSVTWNEEPPDPSFWMHQLRRIKHAPRLDTAAFDTKIKQLLAAH